MRISLWIYKKNYVNMHLRQTFYSEELPSLHEIFLNLCRMGTNLYINQITRFPLSTKYPIQRENVKDGVKRLVSIGV